MTAAEATNADAVDRSPDERPWQRLSSRMIWVDAVTSLLALLPTAIALAIGVPPQLGTLWPALTVAVAGVSGAVLDAVRWIVTRWRITDEYVELRTGLLVRQYRTVRRDRIRSVDTTARLRHRLAGLRVVQIGAGQQAAANESALELDAVATEDATQLRARLLDTDAEPGAETADAGEPGTTVLARLRPWWVVYNLFNIWAFAMAAGLLWGGYFLAMTFGVDVDAMISSVVDWRALGWGPTIAIAVVVTGALGVIGLGTQFFTQYFRFELARVPGAEGTQLRTRHGLFRTREVNRDDRRLRGVELSEPVLWRWMGVADTNVISTGLAAMSFDPSTTILPRGPISVARPIAAAVLDTDPSPLEVPLPRHPRAALRRRIVWAVTGSATIAALLAALAVTDELPHWPWQVALALSPVTLLAAVVAYRALGHAISGDYVVLRSGLISRSTAALRRSAVSTIAVRESLLQRRLGLQTVSTMTAAGWGAYKAPDVAADEAVAFADAAAPGLLRPFLVER